MTSLIRGGSPRRNRRLPRSRRGAFSVMRRTNQEAMKIRRRDYRPRISSYHIAADGPYVCPIPRLAVDFSTQVINSIEMIQEADGLTADRAVAGSSRGEERSSASERKP